MKMRKTIGLKTADDGTAADLWQYKKLWQRQSPAETGNNLHSTLSKTTLEGPRGNKSSWNSVYKYVNSRDS